MSERDETTTNDLSTKDLATTPEAPARDEPLARDLDQEPAAEAETPARERLLSDRQGEDFSSRWLEIQSGFVDEPRESVERADALVADLMRRLAATFAEERESLEAQWDRGDDVSTEDLRVALTRYRSFFDRLLSA